MAPRRIAQSVVQPPSEVLARCSTPLDYDSLRPRHLHRYVLGSPDGVGNISAPGERGLPGGSESLKQIAHRSSPPILNPGALVRSGS